MKGGGGYSSNLLVGGCSLILASASWLRPKNAIFPTYFQTLRPLKLPFWQFSDKNGNWFYIVCVIREV